MTTKRNMRSQYARYVLNNSHSVFVWDAIRLSIAKAVSTIFTRKGFYLVISYHHMAHRVFFTSTVALIRLNSSKPTVKLAPPIYVPNASSPLVWPIILSSFLKLPPCMTSAHWNFNYSRLSLHRNLQSSPVHRTKPLSKHTLTLRTNV